MSLVLLLLLMVRVALLMLVLLIAYAGDIVCCCAKGAGCIVDDVGVDTCFKGSYKLQEVVLYGILCFVMHNHAKCLHVTCGADAMPCA